MALAYALLLSRIGGIPDKGIKTMLGRIVTGLLSLAASCISFPTLEAVAEEYMQVSAVAAGLSIVSVRDRAEIAVLAFGYNCAPVSEPRLSSTAGGKMPSNNVTRIFGKPDEERILGRHARQYSGMFDLAALDSVLAGHPLIGKWYNGLGAGQYIRYQFTDVGAYAYSSPIRSGSGTFAIENDRLTLRASDGTVEIYTFWFECIGRGSFSEYLTLRSNATHLETPYVRDPTDPGQRCM